MELGAQIKKYRNEKELSQEALAEKVYVSRQTVSNWENDKNYPDINSLLRLSEIFDVSLDILIKGDVEKMKEEIKLEDRSNFEKLSRVFGILFFATMITPVPLAHFLGITGIVIWLMLAISNLFVAFKVEKMKKQFDIQTYREIIAFTEGQQLDEIEKSREEGKRPYQKVLLAFAAGFVTLLIAIISVFLLKM